MLVTEKPKPTPFAVEMLRRRKAAGIDSQAEAARVCGVSSSLWGQVETGYQSMGKDANGVPQYKPKAPERSFVVKVARGLNWPLNEALELAGFDPEPDLHDPAPNIPRPDFMEDWRKLTSSQKKAFELLVHSWANPNANIAALAAAMHTDPQPSPVPGNTPRAGNDKIVTGPDVTSSGSRRRG